jgi:hypothetical protein
MHEIDESLLPGILREIAELVGIPDTLKLVSHYGGMRLYVPKHLPDEHVLIDIVGIDAAIKLSERFGGMDHFDIPKAQAVSIALRNSKIREEYPSSSHRKLALKYGLTERQVRKILSGQAENERSEQMNLFDR